MKNKLIRIASVVFLTVLLTLGMSVGTMAEEELELGYGEGMILNYGTASIENATLQNHDLSQGAIDFAVGQMRYSATEIKLYQNGYRLDVSEHDDIMYACRYAAPDLFYMADGYSYSYLSRLFSSTMGSTLRQYYNQRRFEKAVELLREPRTLADIAEQLGFADTANFCRAFKKQYKISPGEYRRRNQ